MGACCYKMGFFITNLGSICMSSVLLLLLLLLLHTG
jgi:hypothetical protein